MRKQLINISFFRMVDVIMRSLRREESIPKFHWRDNQGQYYPIEQVDLLYAIGTYDDGAVVEQNDFLNNENLFMEIEVDANDELCIRDTDEIKEKEIAELAKRHEELFKVIIWGNPTEEERKEYEKVVETINRKFVEKFGGNIRMV